MPNCHMSVVGGAVKLVICYAREALAGVYTQFQRPRNNVASLLNGMP